ncbi:NADH-quinone oxidoreductase subunit J [Methylomagnum ishizawai]|uniref:NADH-quinone oxidoreductase subunit J n=1 Tax=Methylomagnum ishizawai TaxID=1760988 RepID=A0A1Y6CW29_9GAMM|nr:NADH-quinone oxidoreductase subunit J [Methylomagnum ishizawai]
MLQILFYSAAGVAVVSTLLVVASAHAVHALLYLILSLLASAVVFYLMGAYFAALLEVIIYAGAIMVLFLFVVMMLNLGQQTQEQEKRWLEPSIWRWPSAMATVLLIEFAYVVLLGDGRHPTGHIVTAKEVGIALLGPYVIAVELASMLLLAGLVGAYHLARPEAAR